MEGRTRLERPRDCSRETLREFERLVRAGFHGSDESLPRRIRQARRLALHSAADGTPVAIAGLKSPSLAYRQRVFADARTPIDPKPYATEIGWVYVVPDRRGRGLGLRLCRSLLAERPDGRVFATTRPDNEPMIGILRALGLVLTGSPYRRRDPGREEELSLFLRPPPADSPS